VFQVIQTPPFKQELRASLKKHPKLESDINWLEGRLKQAPGAIGTHVTQIRAALPVFKTRCKDTCCNLSSREGWRVYYAINKNTKTVFLLFFIHKKEEENPGKEFLKQKINRCFSRN
jgi:hypothetical protein